MRLSIVATPATAWVIGPIAQAPAASRTTKRHHPAESSIQMLDRAADLPQRVFRIGRLNGQRVGCTRQHDENQLCHDKSPQYEDMWRRAGGKHLMIRM